MFLHLSRTVFLILSFVFAHCALAETVTLMQGQSGYAGTTDAQIASAFPDTNRGGDVSYELKTETSSSLLIRFAIFQSEGGLVPDGATITSATLSFFKFWGPTATFKASRLVKNWDESQATWNTAGSGTSWQTPGAFGATDVAATPDGEGSVGDAVADGCTTGTGPAACWLHINVTSGVQAFASGTVANFGWKVAYVSGGIASNAKEFISSESTNRLNSRPTLTVTYGGGCAAGPYNGAPAQVPGAFEAEHFDCGGEGVGYHEITSTNNAGQTFRASESVEIIAAPDGLAVNQFDPGEWMAYTINVAADGEYDFSILASSNWAEGAGSYRLYIDNTQALDNVTVPLTGNWETYSWTPNQRITLAAGVHALKLYSVTKAYRIDRLRLTANVACNAGQLRPYDGAPVNGSPSAVSASGTTTIEAEHFNCGGENVAYHEDPAGQNNPTPAFRTTEAVDIIAAPTGYAVNHFDPGEWMVYSINVATAGEYDFSLSASSNSLSGPGTYRLYVDNLQVLDNVTVPLTGNWNTYSWVPNQRITLGAGAHTLKLYSVTNAYRIDKLRLAAIVSGNDCAHSELKLCVRFEPAPETKFGCVDFACPGDLYRQVRTESMGSEITWFVFNRADPFPPGDRADDTSRLALVDGGRDGGKAIKFTTQEDDRGVHGSPAWERSMINLSDTGVTTDAFDGKEQWWAHSVYFPGGLVIAPAQHAANLFFQFHGKCPDRPACDQPNIALELFQQPGASSPKTVFRVRAHGANGLQADGRQYTYSIPGHNNIDGQCIHDAFKPGVWYDFVHHIRWSSSGNGLHEMWMREGNGNAKKVLWKQNISTLYLNDHAYLSIGTYHDLIPGTTTVIHDRYRRGDSFAAVAPFEMPAGGVVMCSPN